MDTDRYINTLYDGLGKLSTKYDGFVSRIDAGLKVITTLMRYMRGERLEPVTFADRVRHLFRSNEGLVFIFNEDRYPLKHDAQTVAMLLVLVMSVVSIVVVNRYYRLFIDMWLRVMLLFAPSLDMLDDFILPLWMETYIKNMVSSTYVSTFEYITRFVLLYLV